MDSIRTILSIRQTFMRTTDRSTIRFPTTQPHTLSSHSISNPIPLIPRHAIMRAIELHTLNARISLYTRRLLKPTSQILTHLPKDANLTLDDLFLLAVRHMARDIADEPLLSLRVKDFLPQVARGVEILWSDLGQERHGVGGEVRVRLIEIDLAVFETDWLDGREVVRAAALVEERHGTVALEVSHAVVGSRGVDGELLVVHADAVAVRVGV